MNFRLGGVNRFKGRTKQRKTFVGGGGVKIWDKFHEKNIPNQGAYTGSAPYEFTKVCTLRSKFLFQSQIEFLLTNFSFEN